MIQRAMILAAGTGSRLKPLTDTVPKALLQFRGRTMLDHVITSLRNQGIEEIIINIHHLGEKIIEYLDENDNFGLHLTISDERDKLMDTGGALVKARSLLDKGDPFLVHNIDIFSDIDLSKMSSFHSERAPLATLAVKDRETTRNLLFDHDSLLRGWRNNSTGETILTDQSKDLRALAFSGIHIIDPKIFQYLPEHIPFSMTEAYLDLASKHRILAYDHSSDEWIDMAHPSNFPELNI